MSATLLQNYKLYAIQLWTGVLTARQSDVGATRSTQRQRPTGLAFRLFDPHEPPLASSPYSRIRVLERTGPGNQGGVTVTYTGTPDHNDGL